MKTSFSSAFLHIGSRCSKQNARLHSEQPVFDARSPSLDGLFAEGWEESGMMVLLVLKQVHLQKDGGASKD